MPANQPTSLKSFQEAKVNWSDSSILKTLVEAASTFVQDVNSSIQIWAASRDWFLEEWGRDSFIALPGLLLATERFEEAKNNLRQFAEHEQKGLIPNRLQPDGTILYNSVDAPLWFILAIRDTVKASKDEAFLKEMQPVIDRILKGYTEGTHYQRGDHSHTIAMDPEDGLISSPAQASWMDADPSGSGDQPITPRNGKCVEINALWYACLKWTKKRKFSQQVKASFTQKFWNASENCLLDVIEGDHHAGALRPNQLIAVSHASDLLSPEQQTRVFEAVTKDLLTPGGLRTLSPRDSHYKGHYDTSLPPAEKDWAYHQGTVWPWLMGPYGDALAKVRRHQGKRLPSIRQELRHLLAPLVQFCLESSYKSLPEVFSGDEPHEPGGTTSQAWSVSETLRLIVQYKLIS